MKNLNNIDEESSKTDNEPRDSRRRILQSRGQENTNAENIAHKNEKPINKTKESYLENMKPKEQKDIITIVLFWSNIIILFIFLLINAIVFDPTWAPFVAYFWTMIIELSLLAFLKYYSLNYEYRDKWVIIPAGVSTILYICSFITFAVLSGQEDDKKHRDYFLMVLLGLHLVIVPIIAIFCAVYLRYRYGTRPDKFQHIRAVILVIVSALFFLIVGIVIASVWELYAAASGAFLISLVLGISLLLELPCAKKCVKIQRNKKIILLGFTIFMTVILIILLASLLDDKAEAVLEIISLITYISLAFFLFKFITEHLRNKKNMVNKIYVYSYKLMPMLRFKGSGSGAQGEMIENNYEYYYFFIGSVEFMSWSLLVSLLLKDEDKYIGFSLSATALIFIYLYIESRIHKGKSLQYNECLTIERETFLELQKHALTIRKQHLQDRVETAVINGDVDSDVMRERDIILNSHNEWNKFYKILSLRCYSFIKGGSQNARPQEPFISEEIKEVDKQFKQTQELQDKIQILTQTGERTDLEYFHHMRYKAYMKGLITLKIRNFKEDIIADIESRIVEMRVLLSRYSDKLEFRQYGETINSRLFISL